MLAIVTALISAQFVSVPPVRYWVSRETGAPEFAYEPHAMATDGPSVVVAGTATSNITGREQMVVIKFDKYGRKLWEDTVSLGGFGESASSVAVDLAHNTFVVGNSFLPGRGDLDILAIKYGPGGRRLWTARYDGPGHTMDNPGAALADDEGNLTIVGNCRLSNTIVRSALVKFDSDGNLLWHQDFYVPGMGFTYAKSLARLQSGDYVVSGSSSPDGTYSQDLFVARINEKAGIRWTATNAGKGPAGVVASTDGSVYMGGNTLANYSDFLTVKFDSDGNRLWVKTYDGPGHRTDHATSILADGDGGIYVTGSSVGKHYAGEFTTIKYDLLGNQIWSSRHETRYFDELPLSAALDGTGGLSVTGRGNYDDVETIGLTPSGEALWRDLYNGPSGNNYNNVSYDSGVSAAYDDSDNLLVAAISQPYTGLPNIALLKYGPPAVEERVGALYVTRGDPVGDSGDLEYSDDRYLSIAQRAPFPAGLPTAQISMRASAPFLDPSNLRFHLESGWEGALTHRGRILVELYDFQQGTWIVGADRDITSQDSKLDIARTNAIRFVDQVSGDVLVRASWSSPGANRGPKIDFAEWVFDK